MIMNTCSCLVLFLVSYCRDFAYVARDKLTHVLKCHVFRCDTPAKNIATSMHDICSKVRTYELLAENIHTLVLI